MQNLQNELTNLLKAENHFVIDGQLNKNKIVEAALKVEPHQMSTHTLSCHKFLLLKYR